MNQGEIAQARRFYLHVLHGGKLKASDVAYMVESLEKADREIAELKIKILEITEGE